MSLANKYRPKTLSDVVEQSLIIDILGKMCETELTNRNFLFIGPAGCGKAQPNYSQVLTPSGFVYMGEIRVGDSVITSRAQTATVTGVFPQGERDVYRVTLLGACCETLQFDVADNHINVVYAYNDESTYQEFTTAELLSMDYKNLFMAQLVDMESGDLRFYRITDIDYIGKDTCTCIYVDAPEHTYITDNYIVTHNTTTARIIGNILNEGKGNIIEIDAATYSGVDKIREILAQAKTYPIGSKYKIFIIDEVHALSSASFQAFLKVLEESPAMSIFALCTTNPEKIPDTILSRVQTFQLSKISLDGIINRLKYVIDCENKEGRHITYTDDAIALIAKLANGGMRDSLTNLDQVLAYSEEINSESVAAALNLPSYDDYFAMLSAITKHNNEKITDLVDKVYNSGVNFVKWFEGFHSFVINIVKYIQLKDISRTMIPAHYVDKISKYTEAHSAVCLRLSQVLLKLVHELKGTNYQQEVALTYLCETAKR